MKYLLSLLSFLFILHNGPLSAQVRFEKEFNFTPALSYFSEWSEIDGKMYFSASDGYFGQELWQFDPQTETATRLTNLRNTSGDSNPREILKYGDKIFFIADTDEHFGQIFSLDPQTYDLERVSTFLDSGWGARDAAIYNGKYWFTVEFNGTKNLWNYDAVTNTFSEIPAPPNGDEFEFTPRDKGVFNDKLYFQAFNSDSKFVLWSYDDQTGIFTHEPSQFDDNTFPTWQVKSFQECGGELILSIDLYSQQWHHYDFELDSCILLSSNNSGFYRGGSCLQNKFWTPEPNINDIKIYDPNTGETELLSELLTAPLGNIYSIKVIGEDLYLRRAVFSDYRLSKYDLSENEMTDFFFEDDVIIQMATLVENNDDFYFFGSKSLEREIYKATPNDDFATLLVDINQGTADGFGETVSHLYHPFNDQVYFMASIGPSSNFQVWSVDSGNGEFNNFSDQFLPDERLRFFHSSTVIDGRWYFSGANVDGEFRQLVSYAPGEDTLRWHGGIEPSTALWGNNEFHGITPYGDQILFGVAAGTEIHPTLFRFDTNTETFEPLAGTDEVFGTPLFVVGDKLFFEGRYVDNDNFRHYFQLDLITDELTELVNHSLSITGYRPFLAGDKVVCGVLDESQDFSHILLYDPATEEKKYLLPNGYSSVQPNYPVYHEGKVWFHWDSQGSALFTIDPTAETCEEVLNMGQEFTASGQMIWLENQMYFEAQTAEVGQEIFNYDPATNEVQLYADLWAGPASSNPQEFVAIGDRIYFTATDGQRGHEMWSIGNCFEVTATAIPDSLGQSEGQINLTIEGGTGPFNFDWNNGETTQNIGGLSTGFYEVTVTDANGCGATVAVLLEGNAVTNILDEHNLPSVNIYPNPASDFIRLEMEKIEGETTAILYSFSGIEMRRENLLSEMTELNISDFPNGVYFLILKNREGIFAPQKIIVER